jgi:proline iminopeptidase
VPYFDSDGIRLWYETRGTGTPLICLAGGPGADARSLGDLGGLVAHRTLVLLDGRAAGRSEIPTDRASCAFTEQAADVENLRRHLGLAGIDLLAHSAGTLTAAEYAARYPAAQRLVLVAPAGRAAREPDEAELAAIRATGTVTAEPTQDGVLPPNWLREAFYAGAASGSDTAPRLARLAALKTPVLALAGAADGIAGTAPARLIARLYPAGVLETLPGCGHFPWLDAPERFRDTVLAFLGGPSAGRQEERVH